MKVNSKSTPQAAWEISVKPANSEAGVRYLDWIATNRRKVEEATSGRIGYMHVPDTSFPGIIAFDKQFTAQLDKDGIIVDERDNSGGQIPDFYTEKLKRELLAVVAPRDTADIPWPPVAIYGPKIMIVNELAGSGGDAFPWFFHGEKIGPIVGTRTWGGLVGIGNVQPLRDGGFVTAPGFGFWSADHGGEWIVEQHGVDPDYVVPERRSLPPAGGLASGALARPWNRGIPPCRSPSTREGVASSRGVTGGAAQRERCRRQPGRRHYQKVRAQESSLLSGENLPTSAQIND